MDKIDVDELVKMFGEKEFALLMTRQENKRLKTENETLKKQLGAEPKGLGKDDE